MLKKGVHICGKKSRLKCSGEHNILDTYTVRESQHLPFSCPSHYLVAVLEMAVGFFRVYSTGKAVPMLNIPQMHIGSGGIHPHSLSLDTRWQWMVSLSRPLYPCKKSPWYLLSRVLGGPQSWSGCFGEQPCFLPLLGFESQTSSL